MKLLHKTAFLLVAVGALNWGLVGLFDFNLVSVLVGSWPMAERTVYILVGLSAVLELLKHPHMCRMCKGELMSSPVTPVAPEAPKMSEPTLA